MNRATKLRGLGTPTPSKEQRVLNVQLSDVLTILVQAFSPYDGEWRITFNSQVGIRVLDESNTPEFWHSSIEHLDSRSDYVVYEVVEGGWLGQQLPHSPIMQSGFYPGLKEYLVGGDTNCVSVLSEDEPIVQRLTHSTEV
jgi:hypothetical protein